MNARGRRRTRAAAVVVALVIATAMGFLAGWNLSPRAEGPAAEAGAPTAGLDLARAVGTRGCPPARTIPNIGSGHRVAVTFDDGPSVDTTPALLAVLRAKGVHATFFDTGEHAAAHPELVRDVVAGGHAIGSHTVTHPHLPQLASDAARREIEDGTRAVSAAAGSRVCLMRPPFGQTTPALDEVAHRDGTSVVLWTRNPMDWTNPSAAQLRAAAAPKAGAPPTILLLHEHGREDPQQVGPSATVAALGGIIDDYRAAGYTFVQVDGSPFPSTPPAGAPVAASAQRK